MEPPPSCWRQSKNWIVFLWEKSNNDNNNTNNGDDEAVEWNADINTQKLRSISWISSARNGRRLPESLGLSGGNGTGGSFEHNGWRRPAIWRTVGRNILAGRQEASGRVTPAASANVDDGCGRQTELHQRQLRRQHRPQRAGEEKEILDGHRFVQIGSHDFLDIGENHPWREGHLQIQTIGESDAEDRARISLQQRPSHGKDRCLAGSGALTNDQTLLSWRQMLTLESTGVAPSAHRWRWRLVLLAQSPGYRGGSARDPSSAGAEYFNGIFYTKLSWSANFKKKKKKAVCLIALDSKMEGVVWSRHLLVKWSVKWWVTQRGVSGYLCIIGTERQ